MYASDTMQDSKKRQIIGQLRKAGINKVKGKQLEDVNYYDLRLALTMHRMKEV
ncbi:hypothetical protein ACFSY7_08355 [Kurthia populi]|uniref:Uncharacterized protein n=1 Tax=Kurthia populi TaxID=1562132 RepID=A0ABW5XZK5_9BACL